jgi:hypothetical protein
MLVCAALRDYWKNDASLYDLMSKLWLMFAVVSTVASFYWDIVHDWGLLDSIPLIPAALSSSSPNSLEFDVDRAQNAPESILARLRTLSPLACLGLTMNLVLRSLRKIF